MDGAEPVYEIDTLNVYDHDFIFHFIIGGILDKNPETEYHLSVSPNPSSGNVTVSFKLEVPDMVTINLISVNGQVITTLAHQKFDAGTHQLHWDGNDGSGQAVAAGAYQIVFQTTKGRASKVLIRN